MKGFTLVECLVAMVILIIIVAGLGPLMINNIRSAKINEIREETLYQCNKVLSHLISLKFDDSCLAIGIDKSCAVDTGLCCGDEAGNNNIKWKVTNGPVANTKEITVTGNFYYSNYMGQVTLKYIKGDWNEN